MSGGWYNYSNNIGQQYGLPSGLLPSVLQNESGFNARAYNPTTGATGIAQFLPSTAANPGYGIAPFDPTNPYASTKSAAQLLNALFNKLGSWTSAISSYSGGAPYAQTLGAQYDNPGGSGTGTSASPAPATAAGKKPKGAPSKFHTYLVNISMVVLGVVVIGLGIAGLIIARHERNG